MSASQAIDPIVPGMNKKRYEYRNGNVVRRSARGGRAGEHHAQHRPSSRRLRRHRAALRAAAFASTYWGAFGLVVAALAIATPLLPKDKPLPVADPDAVAPASAPAVLVH